MFWYSSAAGVSPPGLEECYLALDSLRLRRSDNALIRMNTELQPGENPEDAERRLLSFAGW